MKEKKPNGIQLLLRAVVKDPEGKILSDTGQMPSKSFVIQFLEFLYGVFKVVNVNATDTSGAESPIVLNQSGIYYPPAIQQCRIDALVNTSLYGIVVGTNDGSTPVSNTDYKLDTQLTEGTGAGQITHGESTVGAVSVVGANVDMVLTRSFTNLTGTSIAIKEAGIYKRYAYDTYVPKYYHCLIRDVFPEISVPINCSLSVYYTIRTTV
jgi:hypothetical protein